MYNICAVYSQYFGVVLDKVSHNYRITLAANVLAFLVIRTRIISYP
jgi:hypothetical protein